MPCTATATATAGPATGSGYRPGRLRTRLDALIKNQLGG